MTESLLKPNRAILVLFFVYSIVWPVKSTGQNLPCATDLPPESFISLTLFPHQIGICDIICTGSVIGTNNDASVEFRINEIVIGSASSSNITVRCLAMDDNLSMMPNENYLILAFTNNWWAGTDLTKASVLFATKNKLSNYLTPTSRPPDQVAFDDYRIMAPLGGHFNMSNFVVDGTNCWSETRTFITNFYNQARLRQDQDSVREIICSPESRTNSINRLPVVIRRQIYGYDLCRFRAL